ncbi:unnamed protein product [Phytophthora fragariaefolia]|uniref:Unnamed protein product n=1 Tax=Phytophthora fragariaefolia TaxID=1490495 RepID=A0A9W7CTC2_9STRA|nr:unnamed protein product [Phytophthora fragariaefolia]
MTVKLEFLEPWRAVLHDSLTQEVTIHSSSLVELGFGCPKFKISHHHIIHLRPTLPEGDWSNHDTRRQRLREAMELFTLFLCGCVPKLALRLCGTTATKPSSCWSRPRHVGGGVLGFPDDPFEYSSDFRAAAQRLEAMGLEEACKTCINRRSIYWTCHLQRWDVSGRQKPEKSTDTLNSFRSLFNVIVPHVVLACATRGWPSMTAARKRPSLSDVPCESVRAVAWDWGHTAVLDLAKGLAMTATKHVELILGGEMINSPAAMMNAGFLLNTLVRGRTVCEDIGRTNPSTFQLEHGRFVLSCDRLAYALCGGASEAVIPSVKILRGPLTKSDVHIISAVLRRNYPQPILENGQNDNHQYGFVNIPEGTELHFFGVNDVDIETFVVPSRCRCRAPILALYADLSDTMHKNDVDLYALSIACPELQDLTIGAFNVVVSAHDERWPIKTLSLERYKGRLSELTECLRNPTLQLIRSLVYIEVVAWCYGKWNKQEAMELIAHHGEFLPVMMEKFPIKSKLPCLVS